MRTCVIGLGYLGVTHAVAMAKLGHQVIGIEPNLARLEALRNGVLPIYEPGLQEALSEVVAAGLLTFRSEHGEASSASEIFFICVGTPQKEDSLAADTTQLFTAARELAKALRQGSVVVGKSTVPVGTARELQLKMSEVAGFEVNLVWNPEFLREGSALEDSLRPDRIVLGSDSVEAKAVVARCYEQLIAAGTPVIETNLETSELVKAAANSFLATKISFINAMAEVAEASGADVTELATALGMDERIGNKFLRSGLGFGGGCLPKDIRAFVARAEELGVGSALDFLVSVDEVNLRRRDRVVDLAMANLGPLRKVLVLGASFKPDSDDLRDSPSLDVALKLDSLGCDVSIHDPRALEALADRGIGLARVENLGSALSDAELVILGTEWREYSELDPSEHRTESGVLIDARNCLNVGAWRDAGWKVIALGRHLG